MTYRILITGSRTWDDEQAIRDAIAFIVSQHGPENVTIVHGACPRGADAIADRIATAWTGLTAEQHPADWATCTPACPPRPHRRTARGGYTYCPLAGHHRNQRMVDLGADLCLAFIRNSSPGATDCTHRARAADIPVKEWRIETNIRHRRPDPPRP
ncbi:DUF2493 domain-containing protein [Nonomuraea sp. 10N515B]|uniref:DUF2493 domain-containing protein n=1 Tax=Nonomuraea sp. 10N515B TaxID=3457422 RepID=UPI003FCE67AD